jgi:hypothetical protein
MLLPNTDVSLCTEVCLATPPGPSARDGNASAQRLAGTFTAEQLDMAMDIAARASEAVVSIFAAAPLDCWEKNESVAIEFAVEFMVPPSSLDLFHRGLEAQLHRISPRYLTGRYRGEISLSVLRCIPGGAFHQHRIICGSTADDQRDARWSPDRGLVDEIVHQAQIGWRDSAESV